MRPPTIRALSRLVPAVLLLSLAAMPAAAFVPQAERVADAIADSNESSGRAQALRFELEMRIGDGPVVARGEIVTHPTGMARLELRGAGDLVEKHILQGSRHLAGRNGAHLPPERTREFLPPLFLLQIDSAVSLAAALQAFGIDSELVGLGPCDESDCYVLGDPDRVPPRPPAPPGPGPESQLDLQADSVLSDAAALGESPRGAPGGSLGGEGSDREGHESGQGAGIDPAASGGDLALVSAPDLDLDESPDSSSDESPDGSADAAAPESMRGLAAGERPATLWVDMETFDVRRMRLAGDVRVLFGPYVEFGRVRVPSWLRIEEEPGTVRFDVVAVTPVNAPASAFSVEWLVAPSTSPPAPELFPAGSPDNPE